MICGEKGKIQISHWNYSEKASFILNVILDV